MTTTGPTGPENRLRDLLEQVPDSAAPVGALVRGGERLRRRRRARLAGGVAAAAVALVAAASLALEPALEPPSAVPPAGDLPGAAVDVAGDWRVTALSDARGRALDLTGLTKLVELRFDPDEGMVRGTDGCNAFGGPYSSSGREVGFAPGDLTSTAQACDRMLPLLERLVDVRTAVASTGDSADLLDADGAVVLRLARAEPVTRSGVAGTWDAVRVAGSGAQPAYSSTEGTWPRPVTVTFEDGNGEVIGTTGCNLSSGFYRQQGSRVRTREVNTSLAACTDEPAIHEALVDVRRLALLDGTLTLLNDFGEVLAELRRPG